MSAPDSFPRKKARNTIRRDGWTAERQLRFLDVLSRTRSVSEAAAAARMSRTSAYRLRERREGVLFAALWDMVFEPKGEVDIPPLTDGRLARLLGNHYRRKRGDFANIGRRAERDRSANRT
jgi:hypothetical protein